MLASPWVQADPSNRQRILAEYPDAAASPPTNTTSATSGVPYDANYAARDADGAESGDDDGGVGELAAPPGKPVAQGGAGGVNVGAPTSEARSRQHMQRKHPGATNGGSGAEVVPASPPMAANGSVQLSRDERGGMVTKARGGDGEIILAYYYY